MEKFEYFEKSRNLKANYHINDKGQKDGIYVEFAEDGSVQRMITYQNDVKEGEYREYSKYGKLKEIGNYQDGIKNGAVTRIIANGTLKGTQKDGIIVGDSVFSSTHADGKLKDKIYLKDNQIVGARLFDRSGRLTTSIKRSYKDKKIIDNFVNYWDGYLCMEKGTKINFKLEGKFETYYMDDNKKPYLWQIKNMENGIEQGKAIDFYPDGKKYRVKNYEFGILKEEKVFDEHLNKSMLFTYKEDGIVNWKGYCPNGNLKFDIQLKDNLFFGECKFYHENGNLKEILNYIVQETIDNKLALRDGEYKEYYENGNLKTTGKFKNDKHDDLWVRYSMSNANEVIEKIRYKSDIILNDNKDKFIEASQKNFKQKEIQKDIKTKPTRSRTRVRGKGQER